MTCFYVPLAFQAVFEAWAGWAGAEACGNYRNFSCQGGAAAKETSTHSSSSWEQQTLDA
jgi:hypothetical protein